MTSMDTEKLTANIAPTGGIDIAKDRLDVALHPAGEARQFANTIGVAMASCWAGWESERWRVWCSKRPAPMVASWSDGWRNRPCRSPAGDRSDLWKRRGQEIAEGHARRFAEATGRLGDPVDALMLA